MARNENHNIILERFMRLGDRVQMNMDPEARGWGRKGVPDGTQGTVSSENTYIRYRGRIHEFGHKAGMYRSYGVFTVTWDNGEVDRPGASDLMWVDSSLNEIRRKDVEGNKHYETETYLGPLPKTVGIYEGDIVEVTRPDGIGHFDNKFVRVARIDWHRLGDKRNDGSPMPIFDCESLEGNMGRVCLDVTEVKLHERGNVWKWYTGKRDTLVFTSLEEELLFHGALGLREQIRCPQTGNYHWPKHAVLEGAKAGLIDVLSSSPGLFGAPTTIVGYKFIDKNLGNRARAKLIEGFTNT